MIQARRRDVWGFCKYPHKIFPQGPPQDLGRDLYTMTSKGALWASRKINVDGFSTELKSLRRQDLSKPVSMSTLPQWERRSTHTHIQNKERVAWGGNRVAEGYQNCGHAPTRTIQHAWGNMFDFSITARATKHENRKREKWCFTYKFQFLSFSFVEASKVLRLPRKMNLMHKQSCGCLPAKWQPSARKRGQSQKWIVFKTLFKFVKFW